MTGPSTPNLFVFVADSLRRDHTPDAVRAHGRHYDTVADGTKTAVALPSLLGAVGPDEHGCEGFGDVSAVPTVLDLPEHPDHDYMALYAPGWEKGAVHRLLNYPDVPVGPPGYELESLAARAAGDDGPFVFVEHCWATHVIYGQCRHPDCGLPEFGPDPRDPPGGGTYDAATPYDLELERGGVFYHADYELGVAAATATFFRRLGVLRAAGVLEDTLAVFTSDHGEAFPDDGHGRIQHQIDVPEVREVSTVVVAPDHLADANLAAEPLAQRDVLDLWWPGLADELAGLDVETARDLSADERAAIEETLEQLGYR